MATYPLKNNNACKGRRTLSIVPTTIKEPRLSCGARKGGVGVERLRNKTQEVVIARSAGGGGTGGGNDIPGTAQ